MNQGADAFGETPKAAVGTTAIPLNSSQNIFTAC
jgi:hypothetical protein